MVKVFKEVLVDDIDGSEATHHLKFSVKGRDYSIDLSPGNYERFMDAVQPFIDAAQRTPRKRQRRK